MVQYSLKKMKLTIILGVGALAAATLLLETTLTRLLAVAQFYHFAFLVVSLALLGFGASGALLSLSPRLREAQPESVLTWSGVGFAASAAAAYFAANLLPFDSYSIAWERRQVVYFALYYLALTLPFLCSGIGIGAALASGRGGSHLVYAANLVGSGIGAVLAPLALWLAGVPGAVIASGLVGLAPAFRLLAGNGLAGRMRRLGLGASLLAGMLGLSALAVANLQNRSPLGMNISPYKSLSYALQYPGAERLMGRWNAISRLDAVANAGTRTLPGLSYTYPGAPPPQIGLSIDGDTLTPVTLVSGPDDFEAASHMPEGLAYLLRPQARALVLEPGGGLAVLQALAGGASRVEVVSSNPLLPYAAARVAPDLDVFTHPKVQTHIDHQRAFLQKGGQSFDLVVFSLTDPYRPVASGAYSLAETYNLTVEAFQAALARLDEDGMVVITRWLQTPPSESVRLLATLIEALEGSGVSEPARVLVAYRGVQTITVLALPGGWSRDELQEVRRFTESRRYDLVWAPGVQPEETNRFNRLPSSDYYEAARDLLVAAGRGDFYAAYPYAVAPARDDHPFFFHFFTWGQTPEVLATLGRTWQPFGGSGYFVLLALLALVVALSAALILAPAALPALLGRGSGGRGVGRFSMLHLRALAYFALLGTAFLFVEIPLIQRWILVVGHPTYAFAVVVSVVLLFSGAGSALARAAWLPWREAVGLLVLLAVLSPFMVSWLAGVTLGWSLVARAGLMALSIAPLSVLMGLPFPLGLAWLEQQAPALVPWAWAINGCASVIAAVLAAILSLSYGFTAVLLAGAAAYAAAWGVLFGHRRKIL